jgi:hypothetical protein
MLGNGLESRVTSGENQGRTLRHEFVALRLASETMRNSDGDFVAEVTLEHPGPLVAPRLSVAFWVTEEGSQRPVQSVGGELK